jgi:hypothetical protein
MLLQTACRLHLGCTPGDLPSHETCVQQLQQRWQLRLRQAQLQQHALRPHPPEQVLLLLPGWQLLLRVCFCLACWWVWQQQSLQHLLCWLLPLLQRVCCACHSWLECPHQPLVLWLWVQQLAWLRSFCLLQELHPLLPAAAPEPRAAAAAAAAGL